MYLAISEDSGVVFRVSYEKERRLAATEGTGVTDLVSPFFMYQLLAGAVLKSQS